MPATNTILKNTAYLAFAEIAKPLLAFALILIVSRTLGPAGVGAYTVIITFTLLIENIATVGLCSVFVRGIAADRAQLPFYSSGALGVSIVASAVFLPVSLVILHFVHYPEPVEKGIRLLLYTLVIAILQQFALSLCEGLQRMGLRALVSFLDTAGRVVVGVIMIALGRGVVGIIEGMVVTRILTTALAFLVLGPEVYRSSSLRQSIKSAPALIRMGLPFLLTTITSTIFWSVNTLMLSKMSRLEGVGLYNAASRLTDVLKGMIYSYLIALLPMMSASFAESLAAMRKQCDISLKYMILVSLPISTGVSILAPAVIRTVYGHKFDTAAPILSVLVWTVSAFTIALVFARALVASHHQIEDLYCNCAALLINVGCGFLLIPRFGPMGAGISGLLSLTGFGLFEFLFVRRLLFRPIFAPPLLRSAGSCLVMALVLFKLRWLPIYLTMPLGAIVYATVLVLVGAFSPEELSLLSSLVTRPLRGNRPFTLATAEERES